MIRVRGSGFARLPHAASQDAGPPVLYRSQSRVHDRADQGTASVFALAKLFREVGDRVSEWSLHRPLPTMATTTALRLSAVPYLLHVRAARHHRKQMALLARNVIILLSHCNRPHGDR
jgi:hypothetical protein